MNEILERIAKSLESIDAELKARNKDREILINQAEQIEKTCAVRQLSKASICLPSHYQLFGKREQVPC